MRGEARSVVIISSFFMFFYLIESSISSLGDVDLLSGKFQKPFMEQRERYKRTLQQGLFINKCCKLTEIFNEKFKCVADTANVKSSFFPENMIVDKDFYKVTFDLSETYIRPNANYCNDIVITLENHNLFYFLRYETGQLVQLDSSKKHVLTNHSTDYCIDKMDGERYVLMLCPCRGDRVCVQKCCKSDEYFNITSQKCEKTKVRLKVHDHYFVNRRLNCSGRPDALIKQFNDSTDVFVMENGNLKHDQKGMTVETLKDNYCIDEFSDGNFTQINGFFCESLKKFNKCCKKNESLNKHFQCEITNPARSMLNETFLSDLKMANFFLRNNLNAFLKSTEDYVVFIKNLKKTPLYINNILNSYPSETFCIDNYVQEKDVNTSLAMIFNPCDRNVCVQKCCPQDSIFNLTSFQCTKSPKSLLFLENGPLNYFVIERISSCEFGEVIHSNLLENINLNEVLQTSPERYCIDTFVMGHLVTTNGFICITDKPEKRIIVPENSPPCASKELCNRTSGQVKLSLTVLILVLCNFLYPTE